MRLEFGSPVRCTDGPVGELADVVIDPVRWRVTHLVVEPHHRHALARLVPIRLAGDDGGSPSALALRCTAGQLHRLDPVQELADIRLYELPLRDPDWEVGVEDIYPETFYGYGDLTPYPVDPDPHVLISYDRVPKGEIELRSRSAVACADGRRLGHVRGFVLDAESRITDLLVERGHLWTRRQDAIPVESVARLRTDEVTLRLTKAEVGK